MNNFTIYLCMFTCVLKVPLMIYYDLIGTSIVFGLLAIIFFNELIINYHKKL